MFSWGLLTPDQAYRNVPDINKAHSWGFDLITAEEEIVDELVGTQSLLIPRWNAEARSKWSDKERWVYCDCRLIYESSALNL